MGGERNAAWNLHCCYCMFALMEQRSFSFFLFLLSSPPSLFDSNAASKKKKGKKGKQFDMETIEFSTVENSGTTVNHGFNPSFLIHLFPVNHLFARSFPLSSGPSIGVNLLFDRRATLSRLISEREATPLLPTDPTRSIKHSCRWPRARVPTP